ncbi:MAG: aminotransferase class V-fold PLP-dependent enzyme [Planctomycetota bacterium]|nr:aminotransferase class V-fold PLP-dependent enzyme [Planctomycetota bacterium]MDA1113001.1 aminotransferase class V-fold PLP-dependent enzyme [Planctomycetota bacterium]
MLPSLNWNRAATSADPFPGVEKALVEGLHALPADRGAQGPSTKERIFAARVRAAEIFGFSFPERVIFTSGATYGLNFAVHQGIEDGAHVLASAAEHNSMLRPLHHAKCRGVTFEIIPFCADGRLDLLKLGKALSSGKASWLTLCVASNTMGIVQPYVEACAMAQKAGVSVILDMSQGGGQVPIDLDSLGVAYAAIAGHKGLHAARGIGLMFVGKNQNPKPMIQGGTGTESTLLEMPLELPGSLEAGTSNYPGMFAMAAALDWLAVHPQDLSSIRAKLKKLETWCRKQPGLEVLPKEPCDWSLRLPILALKPKDFPPEMMAQFMAQLGVMVRAGSMCTTQVLPSVGAEDGLLRLSPPIEASAEDFARVQDALEQSLAAFA